MLYSRTRAPKKACRSSYHLFLFFEYIPKYIPINHLEQNIDKYLWLRKHEPRQKHARGQVATSGARLSKMSIVMTQHCVSAEPWFEIQVPSASEKGKVYRVLVPWPDDQINDLTCECKGFIHRGHCHHQEIAFESICRWTSREGLEEQTPEQYREHICPRCGEETISEAEFE